MPSTVTPSIQQAFHGPLRAWYDTHHRDLPWRRTRDPYAIVVSEFMCQQTQVATVIPYYERWLEQFPHWNALAAASESTVLKAWEGLGYYRRARFLHRLAQEIVHKRGGTLPETADELRRLPGIGPYMAGAVASIAFGKPAPLVDGNVERVLARVFAYGQPAKSTAAQRQFWNWAAELMPRRRCGDHNQSLMELGARVCTPRNPQCLFCPLAPICAGKTSPERYPVIPRASAVVLEKVFAVVLRGKKIWLLDPESDGLWSGLPRLPEFDSSWMSECGIHGSLQVGITQYRIRATIAAARPTRAAPRHGRWHLLEALQTLTLPAPHRRMIARVLVAR